MRSTITPRKSLFRQKELEDEAFDGQPLCDSGIASIQNYDVKVQNRILAFCIGTPDGFVPPPDNDFDKLSIEWYLNHSCEGNCGFDSDGDFIALRNIGEGEEICYDYALIETNPQFSMRCECGGAKCRHLVTGNDWKNEDFVAKNREYMHPRLRRLLPVHA